MSEELKKLKAELAEIEAKEKEDKEIEEIKKKLAEKKRKNSPIGKAFSKANDMFGGTK